MASRRRFLSIMAAAAAGWLPLARAMPSPGVSVWKGAVLGAPASLTLVHADRMHARATLDACVDEIARLESIFSLYRVDSALSRLNAAGALQNPPHELIELLSFALLLAVRSGGAFDPTVQPLYRLHAQGSASAPAGGPSRDAIARTLQLVDYRAVEVHTDRVNLRRPGMAVTLNGIAQGYITDRIAERLRADGFAHMLVDLGEARALGRRADGLPWRAALRDPRTPHRSLLELTLEDQSLGALATSAGSGTPFGSDPQLHHLLDPHTGGSANHYLSVSVAAPRALIADGLSTALYLLPPSRLATLLCHYPPARAYVLDAAGSFAVHAAG